MKSKFSRFTAILMTLFLFTAALPTAAFAADNTDAAATEKSENEALAESGDITITVSILGDKVHTEGETAVHTMIDKTLTPWVANKSYTVKNNSTAWDVLQKVFEEYGMTCENPSGYIQAVSYNGETLGGGTNGANSGWLFMINGSYDNSGISEYLNPQDNIVLHYTDDYNKEFSGETPDIPKIPAADANASDRAEEIYISAAKNILETVPAPAVSSSGGEWVVLGLARSGCIIPENYYGTYYQNVSDYVKNNINEKEQLHTSRSTDNSRVILALTAIGRDAADIDGHNLLMGLTDMGYLKRQGINGPVWALLAFDSHGYEIPANKDAAEQTEREKLISYILEAQLSNGGWSLEEDEADIDTTAVAVQALAPYYNNNAKVMAAIDRALNLISYLQAENGGFVSTYGASSESCSQVITALTALGIHPETDNRFIKNGCSVLDALCTYATNTGFCHTTDSGVNAIATEQGYYALAAYFRFMENKTSLYDMSDVTIRKNIPDNKDDMTPNPSIPASPDDGMPDNPSAPAQPDDGTQPEQVQGGSSVPNPATGDLADTFLYISLLLLSLAGSALTVSYKCRKG